ncbi:MAG TPA: glycosyltransferase family 4 protein [Candidatus Eisenbacteria bacterium]
MNRPAALVLTPRPPWPLDDGGRIGLWQMVWAVAQGWDTTLVTLVAPADERFPAPPELATLGVRVVRVPFSPPPLPLALVRGAFGRWPHTLARYRSERVARTIRAIAARVQPRLALVNHLHLASYTPDLRPATVVLREHNVESSWLARYAASRGDPLTRAYVAFQARRMRRAERELCEAADLVLAIHDVEAAELESLAPRARLATVPVGVDETRFLAHAPTRPPCVLLTGAFGWQPNTEGASRFLAEGWGRVRSRHGQATLRLVGKDLGGPLAAQARAAGAEPVGYVRAIEPEFAAASVLVVPLWVGAGMRVKIVEGMMAGVPVVATPLAAEGMRLEHGRHLLLAETPEALGDAVATLLDEPERARALALAGQAEACARWSMSTVAADMLRRCESAIAAREARA